MNCQEMDSELYLYADGELNEIERHAVEAHAKECTACGALLAALAQENNLLSAATSEPLWDAGRLDQLEKRLLRKTETRQPALWQEFLGLLTDAVRLGVPIIFLSLFMAAINFNAGAIYELAGAPSVAAGNRSLIPALIFVSGSMLLYVIFKYCQFHSLSKRTI